jgi:dihydrodipicolinate synthase/N-acetylneuraminate lyase
MAIAPDRRFTGLIPPMLTPLHAAGRLTSIRRRANLHTLKLSAKALGLMDNDVTAPLPRLTATAAQRFLVATSAARG